MGKKKAGYFVLKAASWSSPRNSAPQRAARRQEKGGSKNHLAGRILLSEQHSQLSGGDSVTSVSPSCAWGMLRGGPGELDPFPVVAVVPHGTATSRGQLQEQRVTLAEGGAAFPGQPVHACADPGFLLLCLRMQSWFPAMDTGCFHQPSAPVLIAPLACTAQNTQRNICSVLWWATQYPSPKSPHLLLGGRKKQAKQGSTGRALPWQTQLYLKWAHQQLLLEGLALEPQK